MTRLDDIIELIRDATGVRQLDSESDIFELGFVGDDFSDFLWHYSDKYGVDMSDYLWYFHNVEEGFMSFGAIFFKPPYCRVDRIPVSPKMLAEFSERGKWHIDYPDHQLPKRRYDLIINRVIGILMLLGILLFWLLLYKDY